MPCCCPCVSGGAVDEMGNFGIRYDATKKYSDALRIGVESGFWAQENPRNTQSRGKKLGEINLLFLVSGSSIKKYSRKLQ
jgi:hypothetical protein